MGRVALEGLEFFAYHGYYEEERKMGNKYEVNIEVSTDLTKAAEEDKLSGTVNYEDLYRIVYEEMQAPSKMLENIGFRIIKKAFEFFPEIEKVKIEVSKFNPPVKGVCRKAKITLDKVRDEL
jgi:dihydroneopterin aldolase